MKPFIETLRLEIISGLEGCTEEQVHLFKRMYSHKNLDAPIEVVVDNLPEEKLKIAYNQVLRTLESNERRNTCG